MRFPVCFLALLFSPVFARAQFIIQGVASNDHNLPLESVTVLLKKDSVIVGAGSTDSLGAYRLGPVQPGVYRISFALLGYKKTDTLLNVDRDIVCNALLLSDTSAMDTFFVRAVNNSIIHYCPIIKIVSVGISVDGMNGLEAIQKLPGVRVRQNTIEIVGKSKVRLVVDGQPVFAADQDLAGYLENIQGDDIEYVQLIRNPSAQFDAQGNSGIINIRMKKKAASGWSADAGAGYAQASYPTANVESAVYYTGKNGSASAAFNQTLGSVLSTGTENVQFPAQRWQQTLGGRDFEDRTEAKLHIERQVNSWLLTGAGFSYTASNPREVKATETSIFGNTAAALDSTVRAGSALSEQKRFSLLDWFLQYSLDSTGKKISLAADRLDYSDARANDLAAANYFPDGGPTPQSFQKTLTANGQRVQLFTLTADLDYPAAFATLAVGAKASFQTTRSDLRFYFWANDSFSLRADKSDRFDYRENIQALYIDARKEIGNYSFRLGLRGENAQTTGSAFSNNAAHENNYFSLFPTLSAEFKLGQRHDFTFNYGRRIERPDYSLLNPFRQYATPYEFTEGNPFLAPSYITNVELTHTFSHFSPHFLKGSLTTALSFSKENGKYDLLTLVAPGSYLQASSYQNFLTGYAWQLSFNARLYPYETWASNNFLSFTKVRSVSAIPEVVADVRGWNIYMSTLNQLSLNKSKTCRAEFEAEYQAPYADGVSRSDGYANVNLALLIFLADKKLEISLRGYDLLKTAASTFVTVSNGVRFENRYYSDDRSVKIFVRYKIGGERKKGERENGAGDVLKRAGKVVRGRN